MNEKDQFTKAMKKLTESDVSSIVQLIGKFGRNGAVYRLDYRYASRRIRISASVCRMPSGGRE